MKILIGLGIALAIILCNQLWYYRVAANRPENLDIRKARKEAKVYESYLVGHLLSKACDEIERLEEELRLTLKEAEGHNENK